MRYLEFGPFTLDTAERVLLCRDKPVPLTPKAFDTLLALVQSRRHILARDELMKIVWPDVVVEENNLTQNISLLRKVLGEEQGSGPFIETVPKRGYRFVAEVNEREQRPAGGENPSPEPGPAPVAVEREGSRGASAVAPRGRRHRRMLAAAWVGVAALLALAASLFLIPRLRKPVAAVGPIRSLAVLPLENLSGDPRQEYFADGMTEELITDLARIHALRVVSRTSVMRYKNTTEPLPQIARELHVDALVEGAVFRSGDRVRITAQLVQANSDRHLWAKSYEANLGDVLTLQDRVAREITEAVRAKLTPEESARLSRPRAVDPVAHRDYLLGRYFANQRTLASLEKSVGYFQRAAAEDPRYAPAYAGLADSYALLGFYGVVSGEVMPQAQTAAEKALGLDDSLPNAYTSLGAVSAVYDWNWARAGKEFRRALALDPNYALACHWYAVLDLAPQGRFPEALAQMKKAREIDPVSPVMATDLGWIDYLAGHDRRALEQYNQALQLDPNFLEAHDRLSQYYFLLGPHALAIAEYEKSQSLGGRSQFAAAVGNAYRAAGYAGALREILKQSSFDYGYAMFYSLEGRRTQAVNSLEGAFAHREPGLIYLKVDPLLARLRPDPKFQRLVRRMGLAR